MSILFGCLREISWGESVRLSFECKKLIDFDLERMWEMDVRSKNNHIMIILCLILNIISFSDF